MLRNAEGKFVAQASPKSLTIETKKEVNEEGERVYLIVSVRGFQEDTPICYKEGEIRYITVRNIQILCVHKTWQDGTYTNTYPIYAGYAFTKKEWEGTILPNLKKAGQILAAIRKEVKRKKAIWNGNVSFVI